MERLAQHKQLSVVSFVAVEEAYSFCQTADKLGYESTLVSGQVWLDGDFEPVLPFVLFVSHRDFPVDLLCRRIDEHPNLPKVAAVSGTGLFRSNKLLDSCNEVINWPCSPEEAHYRLSRGLTCSGAQSQEIFGDQDTRQEFTHLNLIGESPNFLNALAAIHRIANHDRAMPVLIIGETGTGKELAARAIHYMGSQSVGPFVPVNCGAIPDELVENELFGHKLGAYTDAKTNQQGIVASAEGGTLFLDEVDALSLRAQVALLRFLEDQRYRPLGGQGYEQAHIRVIAAMNSDPKELVTQGSFRQDLLYRLNVASLKMPPLRERTSDIPLLANHFARQVSGESAGSSCLNPCSIAWMQQYHWPGNVRELENTIQRAVVEAAGGTIQLFPGMVEDSTGLAACKLMPGSGWSFSEAKARLIEEFEKQYLTDLMHRTGGNVTEAAKLAGKERRALGKLLKKYGLNQRP